MCDQKPPTTREEWYQKVWETPMNKLAPKYDHSDTSLVKLLEELDVPRPPAGHWSKVRAGKTTERIPLPPHGTPAPEYYDRITTSRTKDRYSLHPLILNATRQSEKCVFGPRGIVQIDARRAASVHVTEKTLKRAIALFKSLIQEWESLGYRVHVNSEDRSGGTEFWVGPDMVTVSLVEVFEPAEKERSKQDCHYQQPQRLEPTGKLFFKMWYILKIEEHPPWLDSESSQLEDMIDEIAQSLVDHARRITEIKLEQERYVRQEDKVRIRDSQRKQYDEQEKEWEKHIMSDVDRWHQAELIRAYLVAHRHAVDSGQRRVANKEDYDTYLEWINYFADKQDPLKNPYWRPGEKLDPTIETVDEMDIPEVLRSELKKIGVQDSADICYLSTRRLKQLNSKNPRWIEELDRVLYSLGYEVNYEEKI